MDKKKRKQQEQVVPLPRHRHSHSMASGLPFTAPHTPSLPRITPGKSSDKMRVLCHLVLDKQKEKQQEQKAQPPRHRH